MSKISKPLNYISALGLIGDFIARWVMISKKDSDGKSSAPKDPFYYFLTIYMLPFAFLIIIAEAEWRRVLKYVLFLKSQAGRGIFIMFVGLLVFEEKHANDIATSITLILIGAFNLIIAWVFPAIAHFKYLKKDL